MDFDALALGRTLDMGGGTGASVRYGRVVSYAGGRATVEVEGGTVEAPCATSMPANPEGMRCLLLVEGASWTVASVFGESSEVALREEIGEAAGKAEDAAQRADAATAESQEAQRQAALAAQEAQAAQAAAASAWENAEEAERDAEEASAAALAASTAAQAAQEKAEEVQADLAPIREDLADALGRVEEGAQAVADAKEAAAKAAEEAAAAAEKAVSEAEAVRSEMAANYVDKAAAEAFATKSEVEQTAAGIRSEVEQTYATKDATANLATKSEVEQTASAIRSEVAENYVSGEELADMELATKSEVEQTADAIRSEVAETYVGADALEGLATKSEVEQTASAIRSEVSTGYATKGELTALSGDLSTRIEQTAEGIEQVASSVTSLESDVSSAQGAASSAKDAADAAQEAADAAKDEAGSAAENAAQAQRDLEEAKKNLEAVEGRVGAAEDDIAAAQDAVRGAQAAADAAEGAATAAKDAADAAQRDADAAKAAADAAQADVDALAPRVTSAETAIRQNAEAISLSATKAELADVGTGGTNVLPGTYGFDGWTGASAVSDEGGATLTATVGAGGKLTSPEFGVRAGAYTLSAVCSDGLAWELAAANGAFVLVGASNGGSGLLAAQLDVPSDATARLSLKYSGDRYAEVKLERGSRATGWTPNPADTRGDVDGLAERLASDYLTSAETRAEIGVAADAVRSEVSRVEGSVLQTRLDLADAWEVGSGGNTAVGGTWDEGKSDNPNRIRTRGIVPVQGTALVEWAEGYNAAAYYFDENGLVAEPRYTGALPGTSAEVGPCAYVAVTVGRANGLAIGPGEAPRASVRVSSKVSAYASSSSVEQLSDRIASTVKEVDEQGARVSTLEQTSSGLTLRLEEVAADAAGAKGDAEAAADSAAKAEAALSGLQVGGRNLLLESGDARSFANGTALFRLSAYGKAALAGGGKATVSFEAKATAAVNVDAYPRYGDGDGTAYPVGLLFPVKTSWGRFSATVDLASSQWTAWSIRCNANTTGGSTTATVTVRNVKLEVGTVATDWTAAPEDAGSNVVPLRLDLPSSWEVGAISVSGGDGSRTWDSIRVDHTDRIRPWQPIPVHGRLYAEWEDSEFDFYAIYLDSDLGGAVASGWQTSSPFTSPSDTAYAALMLRYKDNSAIEPEAARDAAVRAGALDKAVEDAARTATDYLGFSSSGLVVGDMTAGSLGGNVLVDSDSVEIRDGSAVNARFTADKIELGINSDASAVTMCGKKGVVKYAEPGLQITVPDSGDSLYLAAEENVHVYSRLSDRDTHAASLFLRDRYALLGTFGDSGSYEAYVIVGESEDGAQRVQVLSDGKAGYLNDWVVESAAADSGWKYAKFASGLAVCAIALTATPTWANTSCGLKYSNYSYAYPFEFAAAPVLSVTPRTIGILGMANGASSSSATYALAAVSPPSGTAVSAALIAVGRWK